MKIEVTFKTPDALQNALNDSFDMDEERREEAIEAKELLEQWIQYGECITVEFDTEAKTATVKKI